MHPSHGVAIDLDHRQIESTNDEKGRRDDPRKRRSGQVGTAAARHDCSNIVGTVRCSEQRRAGTRTRTEQPDRQCCGLGLLQPVDDSDQSNAEHWNIEAMLGRLTVDLVFERRQQIDQQRGQLPLF